MSNLVHTQPLEIGGLSRGRRVARLLFTTFLMTSGVTLLGMIGYGLYRGLTFGWMAAWAGVAGVVWLVMSVLLIIKKNGG